ncbi:MAG: hypothetical protein GWO20_02500 [Candidatus Korarchaeota archaeon]|nr:hypothetical protein [Candidatus Korarchaeota archaeon]
MKLRWVLSAVLVVIGLASVFVCYPNLYVLKQEIVDAPHCLQIAPRDNNVAGIYMGMRDAVKVQVIVGNGASGTPSMWGDCSLITSPFQVSIVDGSEELISTIFTLLIVHPYVVFLKIFLLTLIHLEEFKSLIQKITQ